MSRKILIFGNSGSGKSNLARHLTKTEKIAHLDLDPIAWLNTVPPKRAPLNESFKKLQKFIDGKENWVIEGCYTDLLELLSHQTNEIIYLNLPVELCIENAKRRPWEPHKYESKKAQDENLTMLTEWIIQYENRDDEFSKKSHLKFYDNFTGKKQMYTNNIEQY